MASRIARNPVEIPSGVEVNLEGQSLTVKGVKGEMCHINHDLVVVSLEENKLKFTPFNSSKKSNALTGTSCALTKNMLKGVSEGFESKLLLVGVGYRAKVQSNQLDLSVGVSHPILVEMPEGITVETPSQTEILIKGIDKQKVSQVAANIRAIRPPEPYKGKGIRYADEIIILKEAK